MCYLWAVLEFIFTATLLSFLPSFPPSIPPSLLVPLVSPFLPFLALPNASRPWQNSEDCEVYLDSPPPHPPIIQLQCWPIRLGLFQGRDLALLLPPPLLPRPPPPARLPPHTLEFLQGRGLIFTYNT